MRPEQILDLTENTIIGAMPFENSRITFHGKGNVVVLPDRPTLPLSNSQIDFRGHNCVLVIGHNHATPTQVNLQVFPGSSVWIGDNVTYAGILFAQVMEGTTLIVGNEALLAAEIKIRTSDSHPIFDASTRRRINPPASVLIGDHVWIGQRSAVLKGARIGSGAIVGAESLVTARSIPSNTAWGGSPTRQIRTGVFFDEPPRLNETPTSSPELFDSDIYIYESDASTLDIDDLLKQISAEPTPLDRARLLCFLSDHAAKNRFYLPAS